MAQPPSGRLSRRGVAGAGPAGSAGDPPATAVLLGPSCRMQPVHLTDLPPRPPTAQIPTLRCSASNPGSFPESRSLRGGPGRELELGNRCKAGQVRAATDTGDHGRGCARGCSAAHVRPRSYLWELAGVLSSPCSSTTPWHHRFHATRLGSPARPAPPKLALTSRLGAGRAWDLSSLLGPRERADHAARRFYALPGRRPPQGPLLSPGTEQRPPGALRQSQHSSLVGLRAHRRRAGDLRSWSTASKRKKCPPGQGRLLPLLQHPLNKSPQPSARLEGGVVQSLLALFFSVHLNFGAAVGKVSTDSPQIRLSYL